MQEVCTGQEGDRAGQPAGHAWERERTIPYAGSVDMDWRECMDAFLAELSVCAPYSGVDILIWSPMVHQSHGTPYGRVHM